MIGGDAVQNIDRIMRLPGTLNIPTPKKAAKGRVPRTAAVTHRTERTWTPETISAVVKPVKAAEADVETDEAIAATMRSLDMAAIRQSNTLEDLEPALCSKFLSALADDQPLAALWAGEPPKDDSGSGYRAALAMHLGRHGGFHAADYAYLAWVWEHATQPGDDRGLKLTRRALARDWHRMGQKHDLAAKFFDPSVNEAPLFGEILPNHFSTAAETTFDLLDIEALFNRPDPKFLIDRHIPEASVGFLYGDPGTGKSFIALDWALHLAFGKTDWHGDAISAPDAPGVVYLAGEGASGFKTRVRAWMDRHGVPASERGRFGLIPQSVKFMQVEDVRKLGRTMAAKMPKTVLVVVDTVSRALPGADENTQKEMTLFVAACDALKDAFGCVVLGVHHAARAGNMRGSTVLAGAGDFVFKLERTKGAVVGMLICEKQKDAPDGWAEPYRFDVVRVEGGSSLVPTRCETMAGVSINLTADLSARILAAMNEAWAAGSPWGRTYHAKERQFARVAFRDFGIEAEKAERLLEMWVATGTVVEEIADKKSKRKGLRPADGAPAADIMSGVFS
ncbi:MULTISPECIES: AAA family ATPase [unclassified Aurantimonas]|uniref:AAA family ATPase n=1 Tax=unclassified Aurantimonas TaxID=2638230 RepID=UPI002E16E54B|nr:MULTISPECIES: AAA family ATPase [unclassified Aurantimonas]MEC5291567.1 AAA family ATPase [Aurantimonas sp. C2-3-R2]MEC5412651.1 AAA family ATPase [Aurantimonas sp. C2-4-R8]